LNRTPKKCPFSFIWNSLAWKSCPWRSRRREKTLKFNQRNWKGLDRIHLRHFKLSKCHQFWLTASTNTQLAERYYVIDESKSARYGYETGYARIGPHLDLHMNNLLYYPKESYSYPGNFVHERASSVLARHDSMMTLGGISLGRKNERYW